MHRSWFWVSACASQSAREWITEKLPEHVLRHLCYHLLLDLRIFVQLSLLMPWLMLALREPELLPEVCLVSYAPWPSHCELHPHRCQHFSGDLQYSYSSLFEYFQSVKRKRSKNRVSEAVAWTQMAVAWTLIALLRTAFLTAEEYQPYDSHLFWFIFKKSPTHILVKASPEIIQSLSLRETRQIVLPFLYISSLDKLAIKNPTLLRLTEQ